MILEKVLNFGLKEGYFEKKAIKDIEKSCCDLEDKIIDFDLTKEVICQEASQQTRKSCDGLCLNKDIIFIEFKSLEKFFNKELKYKLEKNDNINDIIKEKIKNFNFNKKIRDSLWLLDFIINHSLLQLRNNEIESYNKDIEKKYYIVHDIDNQPLLALTLNLNLLSEFNNSLEYREQMKILLNEELDKITIINKPKLLNCNELKEKLEKEDNESKYTNI